MRQLFRHVAINAILGDRWPDLAGHFTYFFVSMIMASGTSLREYFRFSIFIFMNVMAVDACDLPYGVTLAQ